MRQRIWELDFIRGLCVALMIMDHTFYDLGFVFLGQWFPAGGGGLLYGLCDFARNFYWFHPARIVVHALALICFIGICGLCCSFSASNLKRGLKLLAVALLLTAATWGMDLLYGSRDSFIIRFGILHLLALSILAYELLRKLPRRSILLLGLAMAALGWYFQARPTLWSGLVPFALGVGGGSYSADYFPVLPWMGYYLAGAALTGGLLYKEKRSYFPGRGQGKGLRPLLFLGRHSLAAYIVHQPAVYGLLLLIGRLAGLA